MKTKVTTIQRELGTQISMTRIKRATITGFNTIHDANIRRGKLSREELGIVKGLHEKKYATEEWNLK